MNALSIQELASQTVCAFQENGYTERSVEEKKWILFKIAAQHEKQGEECYNADIVSHFVSESEIRYENGEINRIHYRFLTKTATYLTEFHETGTLNFARRLVPRLPDYYETLLDSIRANEDWSEKARRSVWPFAKAYFGWLNSQGHDDFNSVNESVLRKYLIDCSSRMQGSSLDTSKRALKKLYAYLYKKEIVSELCENLLSFSVPIATKIKRPIPHDEITSILNIIDRSTSEGKRDYAMILLAAVTGLRGVDIVGLEFSNIDWRNGEIKIVQSKTEKTLALPLTTDVGMSIRDYILNGRPESDLRNIFLRANAPIRKITHPILYGQFNSYRAKNGLPKCSFHGLRRALGSNMVISGTPVTTVAQVLGHSELDSTKQYISLDCKHLKECALDLTGIEPDRGDLL